MFDWTWNNFQIKNIKKCFETESIINLTDNLCTFNSKDITSTLIKERLISTFDLYYKSKQIYSIFKNKLIIHDDHYYFFKNKFSLSNSENKIYNLRYFSLSEEELLYILLKFNEYQQENITNLKEIKIINSNL